MTNLKRYILATSVGALSVGVPLSASAFDPAPIDVGQGVGAFPSIKGELRYDSNVLQAPTNEVGSWVTVVTPGVVLKTKRGANEFALSYKAEVGTYQDSGDDDYVDHDLQGVAVLSVAEKTMLKLDAGYKRDHDERGSNDRGTPKKPDEYNEGNVGAMVSYGAVGAKGRLDLSGRYTNKRYQNNKPASEANDTDKINAIATFYYRVMPKTSLLFELDHTNVDYTLASSTQDNTLTKYLVGATWEATGKTTGTVKVGYTDKNFDSSARQDFDGIGWSANVRWSPLSYSTVDFTANREPQDTTGVGDSIISSGVSATWTHAWQERLKSTVDASWTNSDYDGGSSREDDTVKFGVGISYDVQRGISLGASVAHTERDSNDNTQDYDRDIVGFTIEASL